MVEVVRKGGSRLASRELQGSQSDEVVNVSIRGKLCVV